MPAYHWKMHMRKDLAELSPQTAKVRNVPF